MSDDEIPLRDEDIDSFLSQIVEMGIAEGDIDVSLISDIDMTVFEGIEEFDPSRQSMEGNETAVSDEDYLFTSKVLIWLNSLQEKSKVYFTRKD